MAYDEVLAERVRDHLADNPEIIEKSMFGGIAFMHAGNMCCGIVDDVLMARVGPDQYEEALEKPHARVMDFTGKPMKGFVFVDPAGFAEDDQLLEWVGLCAGFTATLPPK